MDSSGANNIGNAQVLDNAIIPEMWEGTPISEEGRAKNRLNLDGFPIAAFWAKRVVQKETSEGSGKYVDKIDIDGNCEPYDPIFIGIFNFNYDKKAKKLLGWDTDIFQGFEFRSNTSAPCLYNGCPNLGFLTNTAEGFEWRFTYNSDWIDDYHDGNLKDTIDGGWAENGKPATITQSEVTYLKNRDSLVPVPKFNYFYIEKDGKKLQIFEKKDDNYVPLNYRSWNTAIDAWKLEACEGTVQPDKGIYLEYGVKAGEKDGVPSLLYQLPYGVGDSNKLGDFYPDGESYYKWQWRPDHTYQYEFNKNEEYWQNAENWTAYKPLQDNIFALETTHEEAENGTHVLDGEDGVYYGIANYPHYRLDADENGDFVLLDSDPSKTVLFGSLKRYNNVDGEYAEAADGTHIKDGDNYVEVTSITRYSAVEDVSGHYIYCLKKLENLADYTKIQTYNRIDNYIQITVDHDIKSFNYMGEVFKNWYYMIEAMRHVDDSNWRLVLDSRYEYTPNPSEPTVTNGKGLFLFPTLLNYYCTSLITGLCDNFAKNVFMHSYDGGMTWSPAWYDMD